MLQIHRFDGQYIFCTEFFQFKDSNKRPKDLLGIFKMEYIDIIAEDLSQNAYICLVKGYIPEYMLNFYKDPDLIMCVPVVLEQDKISVSFMTDFDRADKVWEMLKERESLFKVTSINTNISPSEHLFFLLTERQREIIFYAIEKGYYDIPRRITTDQLAVKFNISRSSLNEHLRKIERTIFHSAFNL